MSEYAPQLIPAFETAAFKDGTLVAEAKANLTIRPQVGNTLLKFRYVFITAVSQAAEAP